MKKITLSIFALVASCASMFSQVVLQENFTSPFNVNAAGWGTLNLSGAIGGIPSWFQGNGANFPAFNGGANDYYAAHFNNGSGTTDISNWLFTPVMQIENGAVLQFATQSAQLANNPARPDRLQVRFSTNGGAMGITPAAPTSVGPYTNLMLDINPNYSSSTNGAVSNGTMVNGYPDDWTVYTLTVTGVPTPLMGRFAFRYFVENGGPTGTNSTYIGIDAVRYTLPCGPTVASYTTCANFPTTLTAVGLSTTTYSWSNGSTSPSIVVSPASTTVYTLTAFGNGIQCPTPITATVTTAASLAVNVVASATNLCEGSTATLTAYAPSPNFLWSTMETSQTITVSPTTVGVNVYTVGVALVNPPAFCTGSTAININVLPLPSVSVSVFYGGPTPTLGTCPGGSFTLTASGANLYNYILDGNLETDNPLELTVGSLYPSGTHTYVLLGQGLNGCVNGGIASFSIHPTPTVVVAASPSTAVCVNKTLTLTASGAATYNWNSVTSTLTANPYTVNTGNTTGPKTYSVFAKSAGGCTATATRSLTVNACTGIENVFGDVSTIAAFPNPFTNEVQVTGFNGRIEIFNALGQVVYGATVVETQTINTSDFAKGVYMLKSYNAQGEEVKTIKLIKN